jgi:hypothetical protein
MRNKGVQNLYNFFNFFFYYYYYNLLSEKYIGFLCDSMLNLQINLRLYNSKNIILGKEGKEKKLNNKVSYA